MDNDRPLNENELKHNSGNQPMQAGTKPIFITGIGTEIGKTLVSAIIVEALNANYWKPIQAGLEDGSDNSKVQQLITTSTSRFYPEVYNLKLPASPHIAAREEQHFKSINDDNSEKL